VDMKGILPFTIAILVLLSSGGSHAKAGAAPLPDVLPGLVAGARADEPCPSDAITGQAPGACVSTRWFFYSDLEYCSGTQCRRVRCDDFPPSGNLDPNDPNDWIGKITWYGVYINSAYQDCTKTGGHQFRIRFYPDANQPDPNGYNYEEFLTATAVETGETVDFGSGPIVRWYWTAVLTTPRQQARGFFSICGAGTPQCFHLWEGSSSGNNKLWNWFETNLPGSFELRTTFCDLDWCFGVKQIGACCFDCNGVCEDGVFVDDCVALGGRFRRNQSCATLNPPCGQAFGACCFDDGTCALTRCVECEFHPGAECNGDYDCDGDVDFDDIDALLAVLNGETPCDWGNADCNDDFILDFDDINCFVAQLGYVCPTARTQGNVWLGANTTCAQCCTIVPGAPTEGEPRCQDGYQDHFNGGCDSTPPIFSPLAPGATIYGESGTYYTDGDRRDTDWYEFTVYNDGVLSATVEAEFDVELWIYHAGNCDPNIPTCWTAAIAAGPKCTPVTATTPCMPPGTYWVVVAPQSFDGVPCGADYKLTLASPVGCTPCAIACTPTQTEAEACGQNFPVGTNGGCDDDPNHPFEPLGPFVSDVPYTLCGTLWAVNGQRDTDWYSFTLPVLGTLAWTYESEIPIVSTPVFGSGNFDPPFCDGVYWGYWTLPPTTPCLPPNNVVSHAPSDVFHGNTPYWWLVLPDNGEPLWHGYPCAGGQNDYRVTITYWSQFSNDPCQGVVIHENEPPCGPGYVDTFNGGCDAPAFAIQAAIPFDQAHCGKSGLWTEGETQHADFDWWKIQLTGTTNKRLRITLRAAFHLGYELYRIDDPNVPCETRQRLDYFEILPYEPAVDVYTPCLLPSDTKYYAMRIFPLGGCSCTDTNKYKFTVAVVSETPACGLCSVTCSTGPDDACQDDPNDPDTNRGCEVWPNEFMTYQLGNGTYGPLYCGRLSTYTAGDGTPLADLDWFQVTMPAARTRLTIRAKAEFRLSITLREDCADPGMAHGWDRACKGTSTPSVNTWTGLMPTGTYYGALTYGNGGGDGASEAELRQFFAGLPCSDGRSEYQVDLMAIP
jgi:hypothetical protein